jgi:hypothetical protein
MIEGAGAEERTIYEPPTVDGINHNRVRSAGNRDAKDAGGQVMLAVLEPCLSGRNPRAFSPYLGRLPPLQRPSGLSRLVSLEPIERMHQSLGFVIRWCGKESRRNVSPRRNYPLRIKTRPGETIPPLKESFCFKAHATPSHGVAHVQTKTTVMGPAYIYCRAVRRTWFI